MQYRWADHHLFERGEGAILFGIAQASLFLVDGETRDLLERLEACPRLDFGTATRQDLELLEGLRDARFLVPEAVPKRPAIELPEPEGIPLKTLVLEVSQDCTLRCIYCYAEGGAYGGERRLLDPQTARKAVRLLFAEAEESPAVTLVLFGGEPLLNLPAVEAAVTAAEKLGRETGKQVNISLTTNGTLLKSDVVAFLQRHRVSVSVSLDGPPDLHDANRPDAAGCGSYTRILSNLGPLFSNSLAPVAARVTLVPEQWGQVEEVFDHLMDLGFHEVGIAPASPVTSALLPETDQEANLLEGFAAMTHRFLEAAQKGRVRPFSNILDLLGRLHLGQTKSVACGAGYGYLAVDAEGSFFPCHRLAGEHEFRVGDLDDGVDMKKIKASLETLTAGKEGLCSDCWARTLCTGGCHYENHVREKKLGLPQGTSCSFIRSWLQLGIELYTDLCGLDANWLFTRLEKRATC